MKITILGAGNVATQLALVFKKAGHEIVQVYNRSDDAGIELAKTVGASFTSDLNRLKNADVFIVAVKDDAIARVAILLQANNAVVAHTSGTKSKDVLSSSSDNFGIFYPLQTLTKSGKVDFKNVPLLIEGSSETTTAKLETLAKSISKNVHRVDEQQRQWIHVAAVFANNFTNHLYGISGEILKEHGLPTDILTPLIFSAIENLAHHSPKEVQTGPAARNDANTIQQHIMLLGDDTRLQKIYQVLTESIMASKGNS